jgi:predicted ATPase
MKIKRFAIKNWKNFREADVQMSERLFVVGPNASGKSNLLDIFKFMRDIVKPGGGLQKAVEDRHGIEKIRCLHTRKETDVSLTVWLEDDNKTIWKYHLSFNLKSQIPKKILLKSEEVSRNNEVILTRPDSYDETDEDRLTQTFLEQVNANKPFREIAEYFEKFQYLHLVPQLVKYSSTFRNSAIPDDPFGQKLLERIVKTNEKTRNNRLKKIEQALKIVVPNMERLELIKDEMGNPHLEAFYTHWRKGAGKQREEQFSDGTLRIIGLLWSLLESNNLLLLEEPELSLHDAIVTKLASLIYRLQKPGSQIMISTHSPALLSDEGIGAEEILLLLPEKEGTVARMANERQDIVDLMTNGLNAADAVLPYTRPQLASSLEQLK